MNEKLESRLSNYKFESALQYLEGEDENTKKLVTILANMFGNVGWIMGDIAVIIDNALNNIGVKNE